MRELFIERREKLLRIAVKENNTLSECFIEEETNEPLPGEIYKGVIKNIVPAINCAFIDIGFEKNAYMYTDSTMSIKKGHEILVEVVKEQVGTKGAKVTPFFTLPGKYLVLSPKREGLVFSKKILDKSRLDELEQEIQLIDGMGLIVRTNAQHASLNIIKEEFKELNEIYNKIEREFNYSLKPKKLYGENSLLNKVLRDNINRDTGRIIVDSSKDFNIVENYVDREENIELLLYKENRTLFDYYGIEKEILSLRNNRVNLKCGGHIVIDKTEAMYVIDVNSGKNVTSRTFEKTIEETNLEAASEIGRQIRVRNLSGIIVVDFIDMDKVVTKEKVLNTLRNSLEGDKNKSTIYPFTELNLVQIARRRRGKSIYEYIEEPCYLCNGNGKRLKFSYITLLIRNEILKTDGESSIKDFYLEVNAMYKESITGNMVEFLKEIDGITRNVYLNFVDTIEYYKVEPLIFKNQIENVKQYMVSINN